MAEAWREERQLAMERGEYHEGVPAITEVVDGGWSKISHKHSYNANSGVGIILGHATGKLLYLGWGNCKNEGKKKKKSKKVQALCTADGLGLVEIKNPNSLKDKHLDEACKNSSFCLEMDRETKERRLK